MVRVLVGGRGTRGGHDAFLAEFHVRRHAVRRGLGGHAAMVTGVLPYLPQKNRSSSLLETQRIKIGIFQGEL